MGKKMRKDGKVWVTDVVMKSAPREPVSIDALEAQLTAALAALAKNLQPARDLSAQAKAAAKSVARQNFRTDPATRGHLERITAQEDITPHRAFGDIVDGKHGADLQAHAVRHIAVAEQAAKDSLSLPAEDAIETMKSIQASMLEDAEELRQQTDLLKRYGADALASFHDLGLAREEVNTRVRKHRAERPHVTWADARSELDAAADPDWARLRKREQRAEEAHRKGLAAGQNMNLERRVRSATAVYQRMEAAAAAQHPELSPDRAMTKFLSTPSGAHMYASYIAAGREAPSPTAADSLS